MSVLRINRHESPAEFLNVAFKLCEDAIWFLSRLSSRYERVFQPIVMNLTNDILTHCVEANSTRVTDEFSYKYRKKHLMKAKGSVAALATELTIIYELIMKNPEGAFTSNSGRTKTPEEAIKILDKMAEDVGNELNHEKNLIRNLLKSDKERYKKLVKANETVSNSEEKS